MEGILRIVFGLSEAAEEEQVSPSSHTRFPVPGEDSLGQVLNSSQERILSKAGSSGSPSPTSSKIGLSGQVLQFLGNGTLLRRFFISSAPEDEWTRMVRFFCSYRKGLSLKQVQIPILWLFLRRFLQVPSFSNKKT
jgi:hypothetical protein